MIVKEHYAPDAAPARYRKETGNEVSICTKTLYNYIEWGLLAGIELTDLPRKRRAGKKKEQKRRAARNNIRGRSIDERFHEINDRITEGHWEGDTVVGKPGTKACLFVLTERKCNLELVFKLKSKTQDQVIAEPGKPERRLGSRRFREVFKSITPDNGCENLSMTGMGRSLFTVQPRTTICYAHPYSAYERGSNEVGNCLIRRFVPKGTDIGKLGKKDVKRIELRINEYPGRKHHCLSAYEAGSFGILFSRGCDI